LGIRLSSLKEAGNLIGNRFHYLVYTKVKVSFLVLENFGRIEFEIPSSGAWKITKDEF